MEQPKVISKDFGQLLIVATTLAGIFLILWKINQTACAVVMLDLPYAVAIFLASFAIGFLPVKFLAPQLSMAQKIITAIACGSGVLSLLVMVLGLAGLLHARFIFIAILTVLVIIAIVILYRIYKKSVSEEKVVFEAGKYWRLMLFAIIPFLVLTLLCAAMPPGVLWPAEGNGYDVLEYHLQVPKEWFQSGSIHFLGHNVYANFPANAEMLYLLAMIMKNDPWQAVYIAQLIHVGFMILFIAAIWFFTRPSGIKQACFATVAAGTCSWLVYLAPLAYVEMGMLFTGTTALALILRTREEELKNPIRYSILIGLILGLCAGFKYTALAMIAAPVIIAALFLFIPKVKFIRTILCVIIMSAFTIAAISPYLIRNFFWTGNPVFPLGYKYLGGKGWDEKLAKRWEEGHKPHGNIESRLKKLYFAGFKNILVDSFIADYYKSKNNLQAAKEISKPPPIMDLPTFGFSLLVIPWLIFFTRRQQFSDWILLLIFILQTLVWLFATHLQARFLIPWLMVLPFLTARSAQAFGRGRFSIGMIIITFIIAGSAYLNFKDAYRRYYDRAYADGQPMNWFGTEQGFLEGKIIGAEYLQFINKDPAKKTLLLGDARPFYIRGPVLYWTVFNHNDFAAEAAKGAWSAKNFIFVAKPDFIYIDWSEIIRLSQSYGFDESISPALMANLSSYNRFVVKRIERWRPYLEYQKKQVPAAALYEVIYKQKPSNGTRAKTKNELPAENKNIKQIKNYYDLLQEQ